MNVSRQLVVVCSLALATAFALPAAKAETITCESRNGSYQSCPVDTRGGVVLSHQLSSQGCWQNDTWGYDRNRIWVNNGCRAQFEVGGRSSSGNKDNAVAAAVVVGLVGAAILASNKNKRDHDNDDDYQPDNWGGPRTTFECGSRDNDFSYCSNGRVRGHVEVYRQLSRSACVFGQSWGMDRGQVWVDRGCRAEFAVY
ncbi:MAG: DUF3011 domain-containing protein [Pseudoxanthomonas sp.]